MSMLRDQNGVLSWNNYKSRDDAPLFCFVGDIVIVGDATYSPWEYSGEDYTNDMVPMHLNQWSSWIMHPTYL